MTTAEMIQKWMGEDRSAEAVDRLARWMRTTLRIGGIKECRRLIREALGLCERCGRERRPWPLKRPDNCGLASNVVCIR